MGAWDDLLAAARQLTRKGQASFSPAELIAEPVMGASVADSGTTDERPLDHLLPRSVGEVMLPWDV